MASSDDDDQMLNKVEDILAATAPEHVVCQLCDEVIPEGCKSFSVGLFGCKTLDKRWWAALKSVQRRTLENPDMKARCRLSDMDKFKYSLRTDDNNRRSNVQCEEAVEYITTLACSCWTRNHSWPTRSSCTVARLRKRRRSGNRGWRYLTCIGWCDASRCEITHPGSPRAQHRH